MNNDSLLDYHDHPDFSIIYRYKLLEEIHNEFGHIVVGENPTFGIMLFHNGEIQITGKDYKEYHDWISNKIEFKNNRVLIVGDGDGGFLESLSGSGIILDYIEIDDDMRKIGGYYFNANWYKANKIYTQDCMKFIPEYTEYDAVILAVTDGFIREQLFEAIDKFSNYVRSGGKLIGSIGCVLDKHYELKKEQIISHKVPSSFGLGFEEKYFPGFFSEFGIFIRHMN